MSKALLPFFEYDNKPKFPLSKEQIRAREKILTRSKNKEYKIIEVSCPICASAEYDVLLTTDKYGLPNKIVQCASCRLVYNQKRFDDGALKDIYENLYRQIEKPPENTSSEQLFFQEREKGRQIYKKIKPYLSGKKGWIIEIGCGSGGALIPFKEAGYEVLGFDFDENYLAHGRSDGLTLLNEDFYAYLKDKNLLINVVILEQTLEHIFDINLFFRNLNELISENTLIYVGVPGLCNIHEHYSGNVVEYFAFFHLYHFDAKRLSMLFAKHHFTMLSIDENVCAIAIKGNQVDKPKAEDVRAYLLSVHKKWYRIYQWQKCRSWLMFPFRILRYLFLTVART